MDGVVALFGNGEPRLAARIFDHQACAFGEHEYGREAFRNNSVSVGDCSQGCAAVKAHIAFYGVKSARTGRAAFTHVEGVIFDFASVVMRTCALVFVATHVHADACLAVKIGRDVDGGVLGEVAVNFVLEVAVKAAVVAKVYPHAPVVALPPRAA